ncbi:hypothetical protein pb186bvf_006528 [Paramecium bursaria]
MCFNIQTIDPPTEGTRKAVMMLKLLAISEAIAVLLQLIVIGDFGIFFQLFLVFILYMAWAQLNACNIVFYEIYILQQMLFIFIIFGTRVQNGEKFFGEYDPVHRNSQAMLIVYFILFFYYIGACTVGFLAYKEFRIYQYDTQSGVAYQQYQGEQAQSPVLPQQNRQQPQQNRQQAPPPQQGNFVAFGGQGVRLG